MPAVKDRGSVKPESKPLHPGWTAAIVVGTVALLGGGILRHHWQPQQQVEAHTNQLLDAMADRNWGEVSQLIADHYSDDWGFTKETGLDYSQQLFQQFTRLSFEPRTIEVTLSNNQQIGEARTKFQVDGTSRSPIATIAQTQLNALAEPFTFTWEQQSWKPFDWQLIKLDHPSLDLEGGPWGGSPF